MRETHDKIRSGLDPTKGSAVSKVRVRGQLDDVTREISRDLNMPSVNDKEHLQHPVDLSDTKVRGLDDHEDIRQGSTMT